MFEAPPQIKSAVAGPGNVAVALPPSSSELDLNKILATIWRGKVTILWTTLLALLAALLIVLFVPHQFKAVTQILIDPTDLHAVGNDLTPTSQMSDIAVLQVESQVRVLTSDSVLRRVIKSEDLDHDSEFARPPSRLGTWLRSLGLSGSPNVANDPTLAALITLKRNLQVKRAERTYVVDVSVTSRDAQKSGRIANAIARAYLAEQTDVRSDAARQVSQSLSARLDELQNRVREAEERVEKFKARNNIVGASGQLVNEQQLSELNNQLGAARVRTAEAKARLEQVERVQRSKTDVGAFPEAVQSPTITALRSQYAEIVRREAEQMSSLGPRHPAVVDIQAQAERLRRMIEEEVNRIALAARSEYESARANEEALAHNLEALKHNTIVTNEAMVTLRELEREVQASRAVYEAFLVRARETSEQQRLDTKNIRVISWADPPLRRSFPPSNTLLALGALVLGIVGGSGLILLRAASTMPVPPLPAEHVPATVGSSVKRLPPPAPAVPVLAALPDFDPAFGLEAATEPRSAFAAALRKVQDAVWPGENDRHSSVLITAYDDQDDTAAVALSLAGLAAQTQRVLLVDADLEQRTLAAVDAAQSEAGLVDVAVRRRLLSDVVVRDRDTKINLVPFVAPHTRRDRAISDDDIRFAFAQTRQFELVIVAALDCDRDPSAHFFAGLVDHIVLVGRADAPNQATLNRVAADFGADAAKVRGAVLVGADDAA